MFLNGGEYKESLDHVVEIISVAQSTAVRKASAEMIRMYWLVGNELVERSEWGNKYIETLSKNIRAAFPGIKGFSVRSFKYMAKFAREVDSELCNSYCTIPGGHVVKLLDRTNPGERREWYRRAIIENGWSQIVLDHQIDLQLYERQKLAGKVTNFSRTLPAPESELVQQALKDPCVFDFITTRQGHQEHEIERQMVENVTKTLLELGTGFAFMGRQYHLAVGGEDFYIDLLFYNVMLHSYIVVELKNTAFKPECTGKLTFYVSAVDAELRGEGDNPTIGLLLCKEKTTLWQSIRLRISISLLA